MRALTTARALPPRQAELLACASEEAFMRFSALVLIVTLLTPGLAAAEERVVGQRDDAWSAEHPFGLGGRASSWVGPYFAPSVGGHLKFRPWDFIGVEAFNDNFVRLQDGAWRHDHVIGFSLYAPSLIAGRSWFVAPSLGTCVDFRFAHPSETDAPSASDVLFGIHGGLMAELFVENGFSFELNATYYAYLGHEADVERWSASLSNDLQLSGVGLITAGVNYYF